MENNLKSIAIMILNWNGAEDTIECLKSLQNINYSKNKISIWIGDNNSTDDSLVKLRNYTSLMKEWESINLLEFDNNYGSTGGFNRIYQHIDDEIDVLIRLDNDVIIEPNSIAKIVDRLYSEDDIAIVGIQSYDYYKPSIKCSGAYYINWSLNYQKCIYSNHPVECDTIVGNFMAIKNSVVKKIDYLFDEKLFVFADDLELCLRVKRHNKKVIFDPDIICYHKQEKSTSKAPNIIRYLVHRNSIIIHQKYSPDMISLITGYIIIILRLIKAIICQDKFKVYGYLDGLNLISISKEQWQTWD